MSVSVDFVLSDQFFIHQEDDDELIIFFHGLGATKEDLIPLYQEIEKQLRPSKKTSALFVQAPIQPCHLFGDQALPCWFDVQSLDDIVQNNWRGLETVIENLKKLLEQVLSLYPKLKKVHLVGFSQGGVVAQKLAEVCQIDSLALLSTFAAQPLKEISASKVFIAHGLLDPVVGIMYGRDLYDKSRESFSKSEVSYHEYSYMDHGICKEEIDDLGAFLLSS